MNITLINCSTGDYEIAINKKKYNYEHLFLR
jgi:hypothetical protein